MSASEGSSESSGGTPIEKRFQDGDLPVFEALAIFDETREMLYGWVGVNDNVEIEELENLCEEASGLIEDSAEAFGELGAQISAGDRDESEAQRLLASIWRSDDQERMSLFYGLSGCEDCYLVDYVAEPDFDTPIDDNDVVMTNLRVAFHQAEVYNTPLEQALKGAYLSIAANEVGGLLGHLAKGTDDFHEEEVPPPDIEQMQVATFDDESSIAENKLRAFSYEAAKIAVGIAVGMWLSKRLYKRQE